MTNIKYMKVGTDIYPKVLALDLNIETWLESKYLLESSNPKTTEFWIAIAENSVRGFIAGKDDICHYIGVHRHYRRQGIATELVMLSGLKYPLAVCATVEALEFWKKIDKLI